MNDDDADEIDAGNYIIDNDKTVKSESFEYKTKIVGNASADTNTLDTKVVVLLKYFSNFWRHHDLLLINCKIELEFSWPKDCVIFEILITAAVAANTAARLPTEARPATETTEAIFYINSTKFYVPVVTLPVNDDIKFSENLKQEFKRTIS